MGSVVKRLLFFFVLIIILTSCEKDVKEINEHDLALCGSYGVPGMFCYDLKGGSYSCSILEQDEYGRIMYEYTTTSVISGECESVIIICQMIEPDWVYFYEDVCYEVSDEINQNTSTLKTANDWNAPLNNSKMSRRKNSISLDLMIRTDAVLNYQSIRLAVCKAFDIVEDQIEELCIVDEDYNGHELYFLEVSPNQSYLLLTDSNYEIAFLEINSIESAYSSVATFKKDNGWVYRNSFGKIS